MTALLQEQFAVFVEGEDMHGAVEAVFGMDLSARHLTNDAILLIDQIENFIAALRKILQRMVVINPGELHPLEQAEVLGTAGFVRADFPGQFRPGSGMFWEHVAQHFAALLEAHAQQSIEDLVIKRGKFRPWARRQGHNGRMHFGLRYENFRRQSAQVLGDPAGLHAQAQHSTGRRAGSGADTIDYFQLHDKDTATEGTGIAHEVPYDFRSARIGQGPDDFDRMTFEIGAQVDVQGIAFDNFHRVVGKFRAQAGGEPGILFQKDQSPSLSHQMLGECAEAGADFENGIIGADLQLLGDPAGDVRIGHEILSHAARGCDIMGMEGGFDRGAGGGRGHN